MYDQISEDLFLDLRDLTHHMVSQISNPALERVAVVNQLLDLRNAGAGRDIGLELTIDDMLETMPDGTHVSAEWWLSMLNDVVEHANFLAAGYPAASPEFLAA